MIFTFQRDHAQAFEGEFLGHRPDKGLDNFQKDLHTFQREEKLLTLTSSSFNKKETISPCCPKRIKTLFFMFSCPYPSGLNLPLKVSAQHWQSRGPPGNFVRHVGFHLSLQALEKKIIPLILVSNTL